MSRKDRKAFVMFSGGLDSTTLLAYAIDRYGEQNVVAFNFDYGQRHKDSERKAAIRVASHYGVEMQTHSLYTGVGGLTSTKLEIPDKSYEELGDGVSPTYVPFRNGLLLSTMCSHADAYCLIEHGPEQKFTLCYGAHADDAAGGAYPDCTPPFVDAMDRAVNIATYGRGSIFAPFVHTTKAGIVEKGTRLNAPLHLSWSCYRGGEIHCGTCPTCQDRRKAFKLAGIEDPTRYARSVQ